jgi:3-oxoacyl-[acyl-carrier-protein] synthase-1/3-oxoacyl-[acyl-carrier-protein] synthase II
MIRPAMPVNVAGMGCITAAGRSVAENIARLDQGTRAPLPPSRFFLETAHPVFASPLPDAEAAALSPLPAASLPGGCSRTVSLAMHAALEAIADAGLAVQELQGLTVGVCLGTSVGASLDFFDFYRDQRTGEEPPLTAVDRYLNANPALALARLLRLRGPVQCVTNACSSGTDAIGLAAQWIRSGVCDMALCGGADALARITCLGFISLRLTSPDPCRPFDRRRNGLNLGEGAGILVLASPKSPRRAHSAGSVLGYGTATDAHHMTAPHPDARGLVMALDQAVAQAGIRREDIAFINAHGTGTPANDAAEGRFFRARLPGKPFIATKGCTGHTLGAAGAVEAIYTLRHLARGLLPASPGFVETDPELGIAPLAAPAPVCGRVALSQSLAFGGNNSVLLLGKGQPPCP